MNAFDRKEFHVSDDGSLLAVATEARNICVIRISDDRRYELKDVSFDCGGNRIAIDSRSGVLYSGAYYETGIAAYELETGECIWRRRDSKKLQRIAYDAKTALLYCAFEGRASKLLNSWDGCEREPIRGLRGFHFSKDSAIAVFEYDEAKLENRTTNVTNVLPRISRHIRDVAFIAAATVVAWSDDLVAYDSETGEELWQCAAQGAYRIAASADERAVWIAEQPYAEPPWHRLRLVSAGETIREIRCVLGVNFKVLPYCDKVIREDASITPIEALE